MRKSIQFFGIALLFSSLGCTGTKGPELTTHLSPSMAGKTITVEGIAENRKDGAVLRGEHFELWIVELSGWPDSDRKKVRATGVLAEDRGRPVFIRRPGEPIVQGVEVPEGTDLEKAGHRWVLKSVRWKWLP